MESKIPARLGHVGIEMSSVKASRPFYDALLLPLGFRLVAEQPWGMGYSNGAFQVWVSEQPGRRVSRLPPTGEEEVVADHIAILVPDRSGLDRVTESMGSAGFKPLFPPADYPKFCEGYYAVSFFSDPDNFVVDVYTISPRR
ncbi:MAG: VOC family protein [Candidatus Methanosuratincola sp.]